MTRALLLLLLSSLCTGPWAHTTKTITNTAHSAIMTAWTWVYLLSQNSSHKQVAPTLKIAPPHLRVTQKIKHLLNLAMHGSVTRHVIIAARKAILSLIAAPFSSNVMALAVAVRHRVNHVLILHSKSLILQRKLLSLKLNKDHQKTDGQLAC
jgi:hypothetical protein